MAEVAREICKGNKPVVAKMTFNHAFHKSDEVAVINGRGRFDYIQEDILPEDTFAVGIKGGNAIAPYSNDVASCERYNKEQAALGSAYAWMSCDEFNWDRDGN